MVSSPNVLVHKKAMKNQHLPLKMLFTLFLRTTPRIALKDETLTMEISFLDMVTLVSLKGHSPPVYPLIALVYLLLGSLALSLAGILAGIWAGKFDEMAAITNFVVQPLTFLSGTFYSINRLPAPFDMIAALNPVFYAIDGFRYGIIGVADRPLLTGFVCLFTVNLGLGLICYRALLSGYKLKA